MIVAGNRRSFLAGLAGWPLLASCASMRESSHDSRPGLAITIDDFDLSDATMMDGESRDRHIRESLQRHHIKSAGFVAGKYVIGERSQRVLQNWSDDGHLLGNHSFSHDYFTGKNPDELMADILRCEPLLATYPGFTKLFRFPYLAEGNTVEGRDRMRALLKEHGYRNGHVTIDTSDWFIDGRLRKRLKENAKTDIAPYRRFYLDHIWDRANYYDRLAQRVFGHSINHTVLLHHRLTTALFLDDLLQMFKMRGWGIINATTAFSSPEFEQEPNSMPAGQSLVWAAANATGQFKNELRFPGEDGDYEEPKMNALGL